MIIIISLFLSFPIMAQITLPEPSVIVQQTFSYQPIAGAYSRDIAVTPDDKFLVVIYGQILATSENGMSWTTQNVSNSLTLTYQTGGHPGHMHGTYGDLNGNVNWVYTGGCQGRLAVPVHRYFVRASYQSGSVSLSNCYLIDDRMGGSENYFCSYTGFGGYTISEDTTIIAYQWTNGTGYESPHVLITYNGGQTFQGLGGGTSQVGVGEANPSGWSMNNAPQVVPYKGGVMAIWTEGNYRFRYSYFNGTSWSAVTPIDDAYAKRPAKDAANLLLFRTTADERYVHLITPCTQEGTIDLLDIRWDGTAWKDTILISSPAWAHQVHNVVNTVCGDWVFNFYTYDGAIKCIAYNSVENRWLEPRTIIDDSCNNLALSAPHVSPAGYVPLVWMDKKWDDASAPAPKIKFLKIPTNFLLQGSTSVSKSTSASSPVFFAANHPNPFSASTVLKYRLAENTNISLSVFAADGKRVAVLAEGKQAAGAHEVTWNAAHLAIGVYYAMLKIGNQQQTLKLLRL
ncbi:MAG: T9SS type A sorting domain-containing protein [Fibrobacterota bacterium]